ncbi:transposase [Streptomyces sp. NPDC056061]|uniref:transposase n=1 Tax=Streptomyces sp. NPDC056061 TaxID=3345700 RepID=UPI0035E1E368
MSRALPDEVWHPASEQDGTRIIVRRERPHLGRPTVRVRPRRGHAPPGLSDRHPLRRSLAAAPGGPTPRARVEDRIRCGKTTGFGRFPTRRFTLNQAWLGLSPAATAVLAWTQTLLLEGELATAEPQKLCCRLLHAAPVLLVAIRCLRLRIAVTWPGRHELINAFARLTVLPRPTA